MRRALELSVWLILFPVAFAWFVLDRHVHPSDRVWKESDEPWEQF